MTKSLHALAAELKFWYNLYRAVKTLGPEERKDILRFQPYNDVY
jgi:hypothetical protein